MGDVNDINNVRKDLERRHPVDLTDVRSGESPDVGVIPVPSGADIHLKEAGVHDETGSLPANVSLIIREQGGTTITTVTSLSTDLTNTLSGQTSIVLELDNASANDLTLGGFLNFEIIG